METRTKTLSSSTLSMMRYFTKQNRRTWISGLTRQCSEGEKCEATNLTCHLASPLNCSNPIASSSATTAEVRATSANA